MSPEDPTSPEEVTNFPGIISCKENRTWTPPDSFQTRSMWKPVMFLPPQPDMCLKPQLPVLSNIASIIWMVTSHILQLRRARPREYTSCSQRRGKEEAWFLLSAQSFSSWFRLAWRSPRPLPTPSPPYKWALGVHHTVQTKEFKASLTQTFAFLLLPHYLSYSPKKQDKVPCCFPGLETELEGEMGKLPASAALGA
jgi:hypothetical protein